MPREAREQISHRKVYEHVWNTIECKQTQLPVALEIVVLLYKLNTSVLYRYYTILLPRREFQFSSVLHTYTAPVVGIKKVIYLPMYIGLNIITQAVLHWIPVEIDGVGKSSPLALFSVLNKRH